MRIALLTLACLYGANALSYAPFVKVPQGQAAVSCDVNKLHFCTFQLYAQIGLTQWPQCYWQFDSELRHFIGTNATRMLMYCGYWGTFMNKCLGDMYSSCINAKYLMNVLGFSDQNAYGTVELAARSTYSCLPKTLSVLLPNWKCFIEAQMSSQSQFQQCSDTFNNQLQNDFPNHCRYGTQFAGCIGLPVTSQCGVKVGHVTCMEVATSLNAIWPKCNIECM